MNTPTIPKLVAFMVGVVLVAATLVTVQIIASYEPTHHRPFSIYHEK